MGYFNKGIMTKFSGNALSLKYKDCTFKFILKDVLLSSAAKSCSTLCDPMGCSMLLSDAYFNCMSHLQYYSIQCLRKYDYFQLHLKSSVAFLHLCQL